MMNTAESIVQGISVRRVRTDAEYDECVKLEMATWGDHFREMVPATIFKISQRLGGVTAGAFAADGLLLGFVFGITGVENGSIVHWSDMLAVRSDVQNYGIGRRLKIFQRDAVRQIGATRMYWSYDLLVARNAHLNLNRLGARVVEYVENMYGEDTGSAVHSGFGTDRFVVEWDMREESSDVVEMLTDFITLPSGIDRAPILNPTAVEGGATDSSVQVPNDLPTCVHVEIPSDIFIVRAQSAERAAHIRLTTRQAFQWALSRGYSVSAFKHDATAERAFYILTNTATPSDR